MLPSEASIQDKYVESVFDNLQVSTLDVYDSEVCDSKTLLFLTKEEHTDFQIQDELPMSTSDDQITLIANLPAGYVYHISSYKEEENGYTAVIRVKIHSGSEAEKWLQDFCEKTHNIFRVDRTHSPVRKILFKKEYRCHHNTRAETHNVKKSTRHTKCNAKVTLTVKNSNMKRSKDILLHEYPTEINLRIIHNHPIEAGGFLRHKRPSDEVKAAFIELYNHGHSPVSALELYKCWLKEEHREKYHEVLEDRSQCPDIHWCYRQYYKLFSNRYGKPGPCMLEDLKKFIEKYNESCNSTCASIDELSDTSLLIAICTPLMKRVHKHLKSSSEIMFVDSSGIYDKHNFKLMLFLAPSVIGGLPLGIILTQSESEERIKQGINLLRSLLPESAFSGTQYPDIIMADDIKSEKEALAHHFPNSLLLLSHFHILQSFWQYILNKEQRVAMNDRTAIFFLFKNILNAHDCLSLDQAFDYAINHECVAKYKSVKAYFEIMMSRSQEWALFEREQMSLNGNTIDNYSETAVGMMKNKIFYHTNAFNPKQLFDFLTTRLDAYYERKIIHALTNRMKDYAESKFYMNKQKLKELECKNIHDKIYTVYDKKSAKEYLVNFVIESCSCSVGLMGAPCKHQSFVVKNYGLSQDQFLPLDDSISKSVLYKILTDANFDPGCYDHLYTTCKQNSKLSQYLPYISHLDCTEEPNTINSTSSDESDYIHQELAPFSSQQVDNENRLIQCESNLKSIFDELITKVENQPEIFLQPLEEFIIKFNTSLHSRTKLVSALRTFGTYSYVASRNKKKAIDVHQKDHVRQQNHLLGYSSNYLQLDCPNKKKRLFEQ